MHVSSRVCFLFLRNMHNFFVGGKGTEPFFLYCIFHSFSVSSFDSRYSMAPLSRLFFLLALLSLAAPRASAADVYVAEAVLRFPLLRVAQWNSDRIVALVVGIR